MQSQQCSTFDQPCVLCFFFFFFYLSRDHQSNYQFIDKWRVCWINLSALQPLNLKSLLNSMMTGFLCLWLGLSGPVRVEVGGQNRAGMEQPTGGLTFDPVLERDSHLSNNTIIPAYSPQWLPAATHNEALCWGLSGQKGPLERWLPSGGLSTLFSLSTSGRLLERGKTQ